MSAKLLVYIAAGGAVGAVGRHVMSVQVAGWLGDAFPFATLMINVLGASIMGLLVGATGLFWTPSDEVRALLAIGVLGAFTTFSTFSMELFTLVERGDVISAGMYALTSVVLCGFGFYAGHFFLRQFI